MLKANKHIEIVCSTETGLSSMSQESRLAILGVLSKHYAKVEIAIVNNLSDLEELVGRKPDLVFLGMKFVPVNPVLGRQDIDKIWLSDYFDEHDIAYTGSSQIAHELELNKHLAKQRVLDAGLDTSKSFVMGQNQPYQRSAMPLTFPLFIKPTDRGGGLGIDSDSLAHNFDDLESKVRSITTELQSDSLVEEYLPGREFSVAILKDEYSEEFALMPLELIAPMDKRGDRILSGQVKSEDTESFASVTDESIKSKISQLAINVFYALGARDYGRIDIRLDALGVPQFLEANLLPSLINGYGNFPKACKLNIGLEYEPMILAITRLGLKRDMNIQEEKSMLSSTVLPYLETALLPAV